MAGRRNAAVAAATVAALLGIGAAWRSCGTRGALEPAGSTRAEAASATVADQRTRAEPPGAGVTRAVDPGAMPSPPAPPAPPAPAVTASATARRTPRPVDVAGWNDVKPAFSFRELGRMGPYVKTALDAARADMEFCFRGRAPERDAPAADPAVLTLYLEAREGALDVVETEVDHRGAQPSALVECCREVLRGLEIPVFNVAPGQRYRLKYALE